MGIRGLMKFIADNAPRAIKEHEKSTALTGQKIAIDASMSLYQFMIAIRDGAQFGNLTNEQGETTSHIVGMANRVIRLLENGIKPVYVFDGKPPRMKSGELLTRHEKRQKAEAELETAKESGDQEAVKKFVGRTVKVTRQHNEDIKRLLDLMGVPVIEAPCEAEAQCAKMAEYGVVYAAGTDDADALTFGAPTVVRHLNFADQQARGTKIHEVDLKAILEDLKVTMEQFIDFCILCGCDYCDTIKGVGPSSALKMIKEHKTIDAVVAKLKEQPDKYALPVPFPYTDARDFFLAPEVINKEDMPPLEWKEPQYDALQTLLVDQFSFNPKRVENLLDRLRKSRGQAAQTRLESFFGKATVKPNEKRLQKEADAKAKSKAAQNKRKSSGSGPNSKKAK